MGCGVNALWKVSVLIVTCAGVVFSDTPETNSTRRHVTSTFNEGCDMSFCRSPNNSVNIFHITARGENDTIHFVWSSYGALTGIIARTKQNATLSINWRMIKDKQDNAIYFDPSDAVLYSSGVIFSRLIEFDDVNDTAKLSARNNATATPFDTLDWDDFNQTIDTHKHSGVFNTSSYKKKGKSGILSVKVQGFGGTGRDQTLPRLQHTSNNSYFELLLKDFPTSYNSSRFAVELVLVNGSSFETTRSIADQYTPAVFYVDNIKFDKLVTSRETGFMSWKPVTYTNKNRHQSNGRQVYQYGLKFSNLTNLPKYSIAHAFYGELTSWNLSMINISFGNDGDGFYTSSNYTVWGGLLGYGEPPVDSLSLMIIVVISAGLGLPALLILCGGSVMCVKRLRTRKKDGHLLVVDPSVN